MISLNENRANLHLHLLCIYTFLISKTYILQKECSFKFLSDAKIMKMVILPMSNRYSGANEEARSKQERLEVPLHSKEI